MIIYKTTNLINGMIYIGQHAGNDKYYIGSGVNIKVAIKEFGKENFVREILEDNLTLNDIDAREKYWIKEFDANNPEIGYNISSGGGGISEETKYKQSIAKKGKKLSKEHVANMKGNQNHLGYKASEESRKQMSESHKGQVPWNKGLTKDTDERVRKYGEAQSITKSSKAIAFSTNNNID